MIRPEQGVTRALRALALGGTLVLISVSAHLAGGGAVPAAGETLATVAGIGLFSALLAARRIRVPALAAALATGQVVLHYALMSGAMTSAGCGSAGGSHLGHAGQATASLAASCHSVGHAAAAGHASASGGTAFSGWGMLLAHGLATVVATALLARGERVVWALAAVAAWFLPQAPAVRPTVALRHSRRTVLAGPRALLAAAYPAVMSRRGPPAPIGALPL